MSRRGQWQAGAVFLLQGAIGLAAPGIASAVRAEAGPFVFDYRVSGDRQARPVQVFDDGRRTYFQFPAGAVIPVILAGEGGAPVLPTPEGPYHVIDGVPKVFRLQLAAYRARVSAAPVGDVAVVDERPVSAAYAMPVRGVPGAESPHGDGGEHVVLFAERLAVPGRGAAAELQRWLAARDPDAGYLVTAGRGELAARRLRFVVHALAQHGVRPTRISMVRTDDGAHDAADAVTVRQRDGAPPEQSSSPPGRGASDGRPLPNRFDLLLTDRTVAEALQRWARRSGYRVDWQSAVQAPVTGEVTLDAMTFPEAAAQLIAGLQRAGYPLRLALGADQVARVLPSLGP